MLYSGRMFKMSFPTPENYSGTITGIMQYANLVTNFWFGNAIVIMMFIILYSWFSFYGVKRALAGSVWITALLTMLLRAMGLVGDFIVAVFIISAAISVVALLIEER